ncbi:MAG: ATP-binding protein [Bryobacterales bacterium]
MTALQPAEKQSFRRTQLSFGIGARMAALVCAMVALTCLAGGTWTYVNLSDRLVEQEFGRQRGVIEAAAVQLTSAVEALSHDAAFLSDVPAIRGVVRSHEDGVDPLERLPERVWQGRLASIFEAKMRATPQYLQIRLIGQQEGGREITRVERLEDGIAVVVDAKMQQKGDRPYFQEAIRTPRGSVYLSDIELNEEEGKIVIPEIPVLRAAGPVYLPDGRLFGIVVINKDMRQRFERMREILAGGYSLFLFNERGDLLMHTNAEHLFVLPAHSGSRLEDRFPQMRHALDSPHTSHAVTYDTASGKRVAATLKAWHYDPAQPRRFYGLLLTSSYDAAVSASRADRTRTVWFGTLLMAVTVGAVLAASRKITRPLREITQAVEDFAIGKADLRLPIAASDEAGTLARAFGRMSRQVRDQQEALEAEVVERRRTEESLRESEQQLRLALNAAQAGIWIFDPRANVNVWDERLERMFGLQPNTFAGSAEAWAQLVHPEDRKQAIAEIRFALKERQLYEAEFRAGRSGRWRHIKSQAVVQRDGEGKAARMIGVCWDITESKRAAEEIRQGAAELKRKNQEMEQFVYSVSHDLKSPVVTFKGFLGILTEDLQAGKIPEAMESVHRLGHAAQRMSRLIDDLLQFSRIRRGANQPETIDVADLVSELAEEAREQFATPQVRIDIQDDLPNLVADPTAVSRLFQNLLSNAFKYGLGGPEPRVEVGGSVTGEEVRFYVRDNGAGIPPQYHHKIFGVFQRLDTTQDGTGIGLAVVSKIMGVCGGRAWVESDGERGAAFWLAFPLRFLAQMPEVVTRSSA